MPEAASIGQAIEALCPGCGICCNGVLFADVELQPGDATARLAELGMPLTLKRSGRAAEPATRGAQAGSGRLKIDQPCPALEAGGWCRIYADRPNHCRVFECALLKAVGAGQVEAPAARRLVATALEGAARVRELLRRLGNAEEALALSVRFRRLRAGLVLRECDDEQATLSGELSLAVHHLNQVLREVFYPKPED